MSQSRSQFLIHPLTLFVGVWLLCFLLYAMHLSGLLIFDIGDVWRIVKWIIFPFIATVITFNLFYFLSPKKSPAFTTADINDDGYLRRLEKNVDTWFRYWLVLTAVEIVFSGGVPILWLLTGSAKIYTDFGLPIIHVFVGSLLSVVSLAKFGLYLLYGNCRRLLIPTFQLIWAVAIVSRGAVITALIQLAVLWLCLRGASFKLIFRIAVTSILVVLLFGYVGDSRAGGLRTFRELAQPTENYPEWLPSGALWFYVYITSPLDNLVNTSLDVRPSYNVLLPRTTYYLFPTIVRNALYGNDSSLAEQGDLVESSLNVSSAYTGPFLDYGYVGIAGFSVLMALISAHLWKNRRTFRDQLLYSVIAQCLLFSIFWNFLFYIPFLSQFFWIYLLFSRKRLRLFPGLNSMKAPR